MEEACDAKRGFCQASQGKVEVSKEGRFQATDGILTHEAPWGPKKVRQVKNRRSRVVEKMS